MKLDLITFKIFSQGEFFKAGTILWNPVTDIKLEIKPYLCIHSHLVPTIGKPEKDIISN